MSDTFFPICIALTFCVGYLLIAIEQIVHLDKTAVALLMGIGCWTLIFINPHNTLLTNLSQLQQQFLAVSEVATFILAVLVIIEIVQTNGGFTLITDKLHVKSKRRFLWIIGFITFALSTIVANVTATIVMLTLASRFLTEK